MIAEWKPVISSSSRRRRRALPPPSCRTISFHSCLEASATTNSAESISVAQATARLLSAAITMITAGSGNVAAEGQGRSDGTCHEGQVLNTDARIG